MHDTAFRIGTIVMNTYADLANASILEIGAQDVNGSLRTNAPATASYVGIDIEEGDGVDIVSKPGEAWPVDDDKFDLVMATSVFEHDTVFWRTFLQMCRKAKRGGHIYVSAPSNGKVHRYPQDFWRFYPDAGLALEAFAQGEGVEVRLVESFIADRADDEWNDFCAVFRREPSKAPLPTKFVYQQTPCTNVLTWQSPEPVHDREQTEDQILFSQERDNVRHLQRVIDSERGAWEAERSVLARSAAEGRLAQERSGLILQEAQAKSDEVEERIAKLQDELAQARAQTAKGDNRIADLENNLRQRQEEISQAWAELEAERTAKEEISAIEEQLRQADQWVFKLSADREAAEKLSNQLQARLEKAHGQIATMLEEVRDREIELETANRDLHAANKELRVSGRKIREQEAAVGHLSWLRQVDEVLAGSTLGWKALMPPDWRRRCQLTALKRKGLFDSANYLARYPDVAAAGMDPLLHYIMHGMVEGRQADITAG